MVARKKTRGKVKILRVHKPRDDRRERFISEYMIDSNGTHAAIRAGYSAGKNNTSAGVTAARLLADAKVRAEIDRRLAVLAATNHITVERTLKEISRIAYADVRKLFDENGNFRPIHELDDEAAAQIAGVELEEHRTEGDGEDDKPELTVTRKVKRWDKGKALDQCMAYLGMHKTRNPAEGGGLTLVMNLSNGKRA